MESQCWSTYDVAVDYEYDDGPGWLAVTCPETGEDMKSNTGFKTYQR
jgi:hypothetical protein